MKLLIDTNVILDMVFKWSECVQKFKIPGAKSGRIRRGSRKCAGRRAGKKLAQKVDKHFKI